MPGAAGARCRTSIRYKWNGNVPYVTLGPRLRKKSILSAVRGGSNAAVLMGPFRDRAPAPPAGDSRGRDPLPAAAAGGGKLQKLEKISMDSRRFAPEPVRAPRLPLERMD